MSGDQPTGETKKRVWWTRMASSSELDKEKEKKDTGGRGAGRTTGISISARVRIHEGLDSHDDATNLYGESATVTQVSQG